MRTVLRACREKGSSRGPGRCKPVRRKSRVLESPPACLLIPSCAPADICSAIAFPHTRQACLLWQDSLNQGEENAEPMLAAHLYVDDDSSVTESSHPIMYRSATETSEYRDEFSDLAPLPDMAASLCSLHTHDRPAICPSSGVKLISTWGRHRLGQRQRPAVSCRT